MKKKISIFLALTLIFSMLVPSFAISISETDISTTAVSYSNPPQGLLLFVGYNSIDASDKYPSYTPTDLATFSSYTNEFVLLSGNTPYNTYGTSKTQIVSETDINNLSPSLINNASDLTQIKADYRFLLNGGTIQTANAAAVMAKNGEQMGLSPYISEIGTHLDPNLYKDDGISPQATVTRPPISKDLTLESLATDVANLAKDIVSVNSNAVIWLPFPLIEFPSFSEKYVAPFTTYMNNLKTELSPDNIWDNNIRGFYWTTEAVQQYYMPFNYSQESTGFNNPMVKAMMSMDTKVTQAGKQMLWIPYYADTAPETLKRIGYTVNRTTIFDYAMLQPGYYFDSTRFANLSSIINCIEKNAVCEPGTKTLYGTSKINNGAKVSYEMELDKDVSKQEYNDRYYLYTYYFRNYKNKPFMIYAGDESSTMNGYVQLLVQSWFNSDSNQSFYSLNEYRGLVRR